MNSIPNFKIKANGVISEEFLKMDIHTFEKAAEYIKNMDYGRNSNKDNLSLLFIENKGTCSTKHALLKQLATENGILDIQLILGIFRMNGINTPEVANTLIKNNLQYIPEAHTYLKLKEDRFDFTRKNSSPNDFHNDLILEFEIQPNEINTRKIDIHKNFIKQWQESINSKLTSEEIWNIREQCIKDLETN